MKSMQINLDMRAVQAVSPQMVTSMAILQRSSQELETYLAELSCENPMLEVDEMQPEPAALSAARETMEKLLWLRGSDRQNRSYYQDADSERDSPEQYLHAAQETTLQEALHEQILVLDVDARTRRILEFAAGLLDARGLFTGSVQELAELAGCSLQAAAEALQSLQTLEPAGVGAQSVQQALVLQAERRQWLLAARLLRDYFQQLASWSEQHLARAAGVPPAAIHAAKQAIAQLNPCPANGYADAQTTIYVRPDLTVRELHGELQVETEQSSFPSVHVSTTYLHMLQTEQDPAVQAYLQQKLRQVEEVLEDLGRRKTTIQRCGEVIARQQADFFRGGELRKLTLRDVAEELELHESTISRAVRNKYVQCSRGVFPMSAFFSRDVGQNVGLSRSAVQQAVQEIIRGEDPGRPLSDEKIVAELASRHIALSRRAVAKYRAELGIPPASARRGGRSGSPAAQLQGGI